MGTTTMSNRLSILTWLWCGILGLSSIHLHAQTDEHSPEPNIPLRIATFNVNFSNAKGRVIAAAIQKSNADIIAFQENASRHDIFLKKTFARQYPHMITGRRYGQYYAEGLAIMSRYPIKSSKFVPPQSGGIFGTLIATIDVNGQMIQVADVHLCPMRLDASMSAWDFVRELGAMESIHAQEITNIHRQLEETKPRIICGDFNSLPTNAAPIYLQNSGFTNASAVILTDLSQHPTWRWQWQDKQIMLHLDYIFHDAHFTTKAVRMDEQTGSDHSLVVAELQLKPLSGTPKTETPGVTFETQTINEQATP